MILERVRLLLYAASFSCCFIFCLGAEKNSRNPSNEQEQATSKPIHVALLTGCDSHFAVTALVGSALVNYPSVKGKYRVTCVTSANCRDRCEKWGGRLHDTGLWYYPNTDPDISTFEAYRNISKGSFFHKPRSLQSLIEQDRPDIVVSDTFGVVAGTVAEEYDIPFVFGITISYTPPRECRDGAKVPTRLTPSIILDESNPAWLLRATCTLFFHINTVISELIAYEAHWKLNNIRRSRNQQIFDNWNHMLSFYPTLSLLGKPLTYIDDYEDKVYHVGVLPDIPAAKESIKMDAELKRFIDNSDKPLIYISLGTWFAFSEERTELIMKKIAEQSLYKVIWSNKRWTPQMNEKLDERQVFMRAKLPQKDILESGKITVFVSHCGASSLIESLRAGVPIIGVPQGRDQYYLARNVNTAKIGIELSGEPDPDDLIEAIEKIRTNWNVYHENTKKALYELTNNSKENLERVIDMFVEKGHVVTFNDGPIFPTSHAFALVLLLLSMAALLIWSIIYALFRCCCSKSSPQRKVKSN